MTTSRARRTYRCIGMTSTGFPCNNTTDTRYSVCGRCSTSLADLERDDAERLTAFLSRAKGELSHPLRTVSDDNMTTSRPLTPADRLTEFARKNPALAETAKSASDMVNSDVGATTETAYGYAYGDFDKFCESSGFVSLPAEPEAVVLYLQVMSKRLGRTGEPLKHPTLEKTVHAISFAHRRSGYPDPTKDPMVRRWLEGHARQIPIAPSPKCPLLIDDIETICRAEQRRVTASLRDVAIVMAAVQPGSDLSAARLASLENPSQVEILDDGASALLWVMCGTSRRERIPVQILAEEDARICPVRAFAALLDAHVEGRALLANEVDGRQLTRQGVRKIICRLTEHVGQAVAVNGVTKLSIDDRLSVAELIYGASAASLRDLAVMTNQYWAARRGAEIAVMHMRHVGIEEEGVVWHIGRSKTDPFGKGYTVGAPADPDSPACPARALAAWLRRYKFLLGREVLPDDPVFPRLDRSGYLSAPISRAAVSALIQRRAAAAGLTGDYGAHSPRSGFVTDAINNDVPDVKIAKQGGWQSVESLDRYYRRTGTFGVTNPAIDVQRRRREKAQPVDPPEAQDGLNEQDEPDATDEAEAS